MATRHWLDGLARPLVRSMKRRSRLPTDIPSVSDPPTPPHDDAVESDLLGLRLRLDPARGLADAREVRHAAEQGWRLRVNLAAPCDWRRLPGCTPDRIDRLLELRESGVVLRRPADLRHHLGLSEADLAAWLPVLDFRPGPPDPPGRAPAPDRPGRLDVNRASPELLRARLPLHGDDVRRLVAGRQERPFGDLADLQRRLKLTEAEVERLIGRCVFGASLRSPSLPPTPRDGGPERPPGRVP
jgi:hypothetical protein